MNEERNDIIVTIATPYLTENMAEVYGDEESRDQVEMFGYQPDDILESTLLRTERYNVHLDTGANRITRGPEESVFGIFGSTRETEGRVEELRGSGLIIARFSVFYGRASRYSGLLPEEAGYSLDIPKDARTVRRLITTDSVLDALIERDETRIREAIKEFNRGVAKPVLVPVLVTPFLARALAAEGKLREFGLDDVLKETDPGTFGVRAYSLIDRCTNEGLHNQAANVALRMHRHAANLLGDNGDAIDAIYGFRDIARSIVSQVRNDSFGEDGND